MDNLYEIYYKHENGYFRVLNGSTRQIVSRQYQQLYQRSFHIFQGYEASDDGLLTFHEDFKTWCKELRYNKILSIEYTKYYSHHSAVELTFKRLCKGKWEHHEPISIEEGNWMDMCNNGGLMYCKKGIHDSYGYDGKSFYPSLLADKDFMIPNKAGKEYVLNELPVKISDVKVGYYKAKITSNDPNFVKIFAFSQQQAYSHYSIIQAMDHKNRFNVSIELIQNGKPNAYLYDDVCSISSIFGKWYETLMKLRNLFPKNKLVKHLSSSIWGHLSRTNKITKTYEEIINEKLNIGRNEKADYIIEDHHIYPDKEYYVLVPRKDPYTFPLRLKSFITSRGRNITANVALLDIDSVIRIHTDNVTFNKPMEMVNSIFVSEEKTTGKIDWLHVNSGVKL